MVNIKKRMEQRETVVALFHSTGCVKKKMDWNELSTWKKNNGEANAPSHPAILKARALQLENIARVASAFFNKEFAMQGLARADQGPGTAASSFRFLRQCASCSEKGPCSEQQSRHCPSLAPQGAVCSQPSPRVTSQGWTAWPAASPSRVCSPPTPLPCHG